MIPALIYIVMGLVTVRLIESGYASAGMFEGDPVKRDLSLKESATVMVIWPFIFAGALVGLLGMLFLGSGK